MENVRDKSIKRIIELSKKSIPLNNDVFMIFAQSKEFCEEFLRVILQDKKLKVIDNEIQKYLPSAFNKYVTIDMLCRLGDESLVNVEIQLSKEKDHARRIFEYISKIKNYLTEKGEKYKDIKDIISIYLTKEDIFKKGSTIYKVEMNIVSDIGEEVEKWEPGLKVYYVNTEGLTNETINTYLKVLTDRTTVMEEYKVTSEIKKGIYKIGGVNMSKEMMEILEDERQAGIEEGRQEGMEAGIEKGMEAGMQFGKIAFAVDMFNSKRIDLKTVAEMLNMSEEEFLGYCKK